MNSQQIKCFLYVAACRSFSAAAQQLYLSQSSVSYHIKLLEKELGFNLFIRDTHDVVLTPAGASFFKAMLAIAAQFSDAMSTAKQLADGGHGKLRICFANPTSPTMMGQIVNRLYSILPLEEIVLSKRSYDDVLQPLLSGTADVLFTYPQFYREQFHLGQKRFCRTWISCQVCPSHALADRRELTMADLKGQRLLFPDSRNFQKDFINIYDYFWKDQGAAPPLDDTPQTFEHIQGLAMAGRGVMLVRTMDRLYHENVDGLVSIPLIDQEPTYLLAVWQENTLCPLGKELIAKLPEVV